MTKNLRTAALSAVAGGALTVLGLMFGPAGSASADTVGIDLDATTGYGHPAREGRHDDALDVLGYCQRTAAPTLRTVTAPGGPTLTVNVGDEVTITLHNELTGKFSEATSLYLGGQPLVPDTTGAAARRREDLHVHRQPRRHLPLRGGPDQEPPAPGGAGPLRRPRGAPGHGAGLRPGDARTRRSRCSSSARSTRRSTPPTTRRRSTCGSSPRAGRLVNGKTHPDTVHRRRRG